MLKKTTAEFVIAYQVAIVLWVTTYSLVPTIYFSCLSPLANQLHQTGEQMEIW